MRDVTYSTYGATGDGTTDDTSAIQAAIAECSQGDVLFFPKGTYKVTRQLEIINSICIKGVGAGTVLDLSDAPTAALHIHGKVEPIGAALASDALKDQRHVVVSNASSFLADDYIRIQSNACHNSDFAKLAEIQRISSIESNIITCEGELYDSYATEDDTLIYKTEMLDGLRMSHMKIVGRGAGSGQWAAVIIANAVNCDVENVILEKGYTAGITLRDCIDSSVKGCAIRECNRRGLGYGVQITGASRNVIIGENSFFDCRHGVSLGGNNGVQREIVIANNTVSYSSQHQGFLGGHNTFDGVLVTGNVIHHDGLGYTDSLHCSFIGNRVYNDAYANGAILANNNSDYTIISNNELITTAGRPAIQVKAGNVMINGNHIECQYKYGGISASCRRSNLTIKNNTIISTGVANPAIRLGASETVRKILIVGNNINSAQRCIFFSLRAADIENVVISNNILDSDEIAVYFNCRTGAMVRSSSISGNVIFNCMSGICLDSAENISVSGNDIHSASNCGVIAYRSRELSIMHNTIRNANTGIRVRSAGGGCHNYSLINNFLSGCAVDIDDEENHGLNVGNYTG